MSVKKEDWGGQGSWLAGTRQSGGFDRGCGRSDGGCDGAQIGAVCDEGRADFQSGLRVHFIPEYLHTSLSLAGVERAVLHPTLTGDPISNLSHA